MKLNVKAFGLTSAMLWGFGLFLLTWWLIVRGKASGEETLIGLFYVGYRVTPLGSVIGLAWALADGFIGGAIFAWLYNRLAARFTGRAPEQG